jgi:hypothetical protein
MGRIVDLARRERERLMAIERREATATEERAVAAGVAETVANLAWSGWRARAGSPPPSGWRASVTASAIAVRSWREPFPRASTSNRGPAHLAARRCPPCWPTRKARGTPARGCRNIVGGFGGNAIW